MTQNIVNIGAYKYLIESFDCNVDTLDSQYYAEFVMLRNFNIMNNIIYDTDIYIIERKYFNEYVNELIESGNDFGETLAFPITNLKVNSYSNSYKKFNDIFNIYSNGNINDALYTIDPITNEVELSNNVYELYNIKLVNGEKKLVNASIKCNKLKIYHPLTKNNLDYLVDICNYINGINFHYLCKPVKNYKVKTETEIKFNNETYSEYVEIYYPNVDELFKVDNDGNYVLYYKEDYNIVASTQNEQFINSIMSNSSDIEHSEYLEDDSQTNVQIVPLNLLIQPYRIIEEYAADSAFNYNDTVADDEKVFAKLYLKNNAANLNNYSSNINVILYPFIEVDEQTNIYLKLPLNPGYLHTYNESKFKLMSRTGFSDGIISIVTLFDYPNKSYFYNKAKEINNDTSNGYKTSPIKEAWKYYNNIDDHYYNLFINEEIEQELKDIDAVDSISPEIIQTVKEVSNYNSSNNDEILKVWKQIMKNTILKEYEEDFNTPANFLGFKIQIATDMGFKHVIYDRNIRINFNDIDDFSFKLNGIFKGWHEKPEQLLCKINFYDRLLGIELTSNLVIITKEWFKYLVNDNSYVHRLSDLSFINKEGDNINMEVVNLNLHNDIDKLNALKRELSNSLTDSQQAKVDEIIEDLQNEVNTKKVNFINSVKCIVDKKSSGEVDLSKQTYNQKIIFKPIFYKVKDLQNISLRANISQNIGINLSDYLSKIGTFKIVIENTEYVEVGRNNIFVIFNINTNNIKEQSGSYNLIDNNGNYISSGNWSIS